jgi:hypothetical protein
MELGLFYLLIFRAVITLRLYVLRSSQANGKTDSSDGQRNGSS